MDRFELIELPDDLPASARSPILPRRAAALSTIVEEQETRAANGPWVSGCGGTEVPFPTRTGRRLLYCWQPSTGRHAYLDCETDLILTDAEARLALGDR